MVAIKEKAREQVYFNWGVVYALWLLIAAYPIAWILGMDLTGGDVQLSRAIIGLWPPVNVVILFLQPIFLLFAFRRVDGIVPNMNKYSLAIYLLAAIWFFQTIIQSILNWQFSFGKVGVLHFAISFAMAGIYKIRNHRYRRKHEKHFHHAH